MNSESNSEVKPLSYSVRELAGMGLPNYPGTERAWLDRVKNENWVYVEFKGQGRGGIRREYTPPPEVQVLIEARRQRRERLAAMSEEQAGIEGVLAEKLFGEMPRISPALAQFAGEPQTPHKKPPLAAPDGFVLVPRYDVAASMGAGAVIHSEQIVDHLAFRAEWVRNELGANPKHLVLISATGDSMEPTLHSSDLLLIDRSVQGVKHDAIYAFAVNGELRVKRIQRLFDGTLIIKSDNSHYVSETLSQEAAGALNIIGRVVWFGRRM